MNTVFRKLNIAFKNKFKVIAKCHHKKLKNLGKQQESKANKSMTTYIKNTVQNFLSDHLTTEEYTALDHHYGYGLDHHIPCKFSSNRI